MEESKDGHIDTSQQPMQVDPESPAVDKVNYAKIVESKVAEQPWIEQLAIKGSVADKLFYGATKAFDSRQKALLAMFTRIEGRQQPYTSCKEMPMIENDPVVLFAILV